MYGRVQDWAQCTIFLGALGLTSDGAFKRSADEVRWPPAVATPGRGVQSWSWRRAVEGVQRGILPPPIGTLDAVPSVEPCLEYT